MKITIANINKALTSEGEERLFKGKGYYYFAGGNAATWRETAVYVNRLTALSIEQWKSERNRLRNRK